MARMFDDLVRRAQAALALLDGLDGPAARSLVSDRGPRIVGAVRQLSAFTDRTTSAHHPRAGDLADGALRVALDLVVDLEDKVDEVLKAN